jgi:hypothetical protein
VNRKRRPGHDILGPALVPVPRVASPRIPGLGHLAAPMPSTIARALGLHIQFGSCGRCSGYPIDHFIISDLSGSLGGNGAAGNDPAGLRHAAALRASEDVARTCRCGHERLTIWSFDLNSPLDVGPVTLDRHGIPILGAALNDPNIGWGMSTLGPALTAARSRAEQAPGRTTLTVMSDFLLTDTPHILDDLVEFPADSIHAIVLTAPVPDRLAEHQHVTVTHANWDDDPATVAYAIHTELTRYRTHDRRPRGSVRGPARVLPVRSK